MPESVEQTDATSFFNDHWKPSRNRLGNAPADVDPDRDFGDAQDGEAAIALGELAFLPQQSRPPGATWHPT
jgi:hypothetical protein